MPTISDKIKEMADNIKTQVESIENIKCILYNPALEIIKGEYRMNILVRGVDPREFTGHRTLPDVRFALVLYLPLEAEDNYADKWVEMLGKINEICDKLFTNLIDGVSTADINLEFNDDIIANRGRLINCTILCTYKKYASR